MEHAPICSVPLDIERGKALDCNLFQCVSVAQNEYRMLHGRVPDTSPTASACPFCTLFSNYASLIPLYCENSAGIVMLIGENQRPLE